MASVSAQSLDDYIQTALKNNPSIKASREVVKVAKEKINEVKSWSDTGFSVGVYPSTPETRTGSQPVKIGLSQSFPWFGTYAQAAKAQKERVGVDKYNVRLTEKELRYRIAELYYKIYQLQSDVEMLKENKSILEVYEKMALGALENNKARMSDILRIRAEKNALYARINQHIQDLQSARHAFNRLLNRNIEASVNIPSQLNVTDILPSNTNVENHPSVAKIKQLQRVYLQQEKWIKKQSLPKFRLGTDYMPVQPRTDAFPVDNGKDVWMISVGLQIPLFNKSYRSRLKQTELKRKQAEYQQENQLLILQSAFEQAQADYDNALVNIVTANKNAADVQTAIDADLKAYETGLLDYDRILRLQLQKIKFQLQAIENTYKAFTAYERIKFLTN